jgi:21S rRNA (GM2251-2'-O)-methyltransferase
VTALVTPIRNCAPWSAIALKSSAGAAEVLPIFTVKQPADFLAKSARNGWRVYATDAIPPDTKRPGDKPTASDDTSAVVYTFARNLTRIPNHNPLAEHPTILMMGAEGEGLRSSLLNQANYKVGIGAGRGVQQAGVDSLNVSVAASLLCFDMMSKRKEQKPGELLF